MGRSQHCTAAIPFCDRALPQSIKCGAQNTCIAAMGETATLYASAMANDASPFSGFTRIDSDGLLNPVFSIRNDSRVQNMLLKLAGISCFEYQQFSRSGGATSSLSFTPVMTRNICPVRMSFGSESLLSAIMSLTSLFHFLAIEMTVSPDFTRTNTTCGSLASRGADPKCLVKQLA